MPLGLFRESLRQIQNFLSIRLFPESVKIPLIPLTNDWKSSAVKVMALMSIKSLTCLFSNAFKVAFETSLILLIDCTNEMQISYYQNHHNEYTKDAIQHFKRKQSRIEEEDLDDEAKEVSNQIKSIVSSSTKSSSLFISYEEFYIKRLDRLDLIREYFKWQQIEHAEYGFSFCQYPFILSIDAKRKILERDSEHQMIQIAKAN